MMTKRRSKWTVEVDKKIRKKFWRALTPTDRDMRMGTMGQDCPVCIRYRVSVWPIRYEPSYPCVKCPFDLYKKGPTKEGCKMWRDYFRSDWRWYSVWSGNIPKSARPLFHKFYREFRKKIKPFIVWV